MTRFDVVRRRLFVSGALSVAVASAALAGDFVYPSDAAKVWPQNLVRALQQRLRDLGHDPGPIDGLFGRRTVAAIRELQAAEGIEQDGQISDEVLIRVGLVQPE